MFLSKCLHFMISMTSAGESPHFGHFFSLCHWWWGAHADSDDIRRRGSPGLAPTGQTLNMAPAGEMIKMQDVPAWDAGLLENI